MSYFVSDEKLQGYYVDDGVTINIVKYHFECDDAASLPAQTAFITSKKVKISMASTAHTLENNKMYEMNSAGTWVDITTNNGAYTLPPATASSLGGVMVGDGLSVTASGLLSGDFSALWDAIYQTEKHLSGVPPLYFMASGNGIESFVIYGNGQQTGTPTPDNPVMPDFVGVRTENILKNSAVSQTKNGVTYTVNPDKSITINGMLDLTAADHIELYNLDARSGQVYTISGVTGFTSDTLQLYTTGSSAFPVGNRLQCYSAPVTRTALANESCIVRLYVYPDVRYDNVTIFPMIVLGNDKTLPYEPYGYKIPITCAGQTVPVYLGQTQTVRQIKKLVLTGQESDIKYQTIITATDAFQLPTTTSDYKKEQFLCSHMPVNNDSTATNSHGYIGNSLTLCFDKTMGLTTKSLCQQYLAQQYAAGTPVTVWYVLAEPETGIVNEPLAKIGDYADELHSTDAGVTIPTVRGSNTLTVETDLQPSNVEITYF